MAQLWHREKDRNFVGALLDAGLVDATVISSRLHTLTVRTGARPNERSRGWSRAADPPSAAKVRAAVPGLPWLGSEWQGAAVTRAVLSVLSSVEMRAAAAGFMTTVGSRLAGRAAL